MRSRRSTKQRAAERSELDVAADVVGVAADAGRRSPASASSRGNTAARLGVIGTRDHAAVERHLVREVHERLLQVGERCRSSPCARDRCSSSPRSSATASGTTDRSHPLPPPCIRRARAARCCRRRSAARRSPPSDPAPPAPAPARSSTSSSSCRASPRRRSQNRSRISSASISARGITGMPRRVASTISGFAGRTADEKTTTSASPTFAGRVPLEHRDAELRLQPRRRVGPPRVRPADHVTEVRQQLGDPAHADAADARRSGSGVSARASRVIATSPASASCGESTITLAPRPACASAPRLRADRRALARASPRQRQQFRRQPLAGQRPLLDHPRRALPTSASAFFRWWSSVAVGSGTSNRRPARRHQLRQRRRAGAADDDVGVLHLAGPSRRGTARPWPARPARRYPSRTISRSRSPVWCVIARSWCGGCQPRRCLHHGHVDRVRALRAAKD